MSMETVRRGFSVVGLCWGVAATFACGDSGEVTSSEGASSTITEGTSVGTTVMTADVEPTSTLPTEATSAGSMTQGMTSNGPTSDGPTDPTGGNTTTPQPTASTSDSSTQADTTMGVSASVGESGTDDTTMGGGADGSSTGAMGCADDKVCNEDCCTADQVCLEQQCVKDCGGPAPCGPQQDCCTDDELCYLGECVVPGPACAQQQCATQTANDCAEGYVCDPGLSICLPSKADESCTYKPPAQTFEPRPQFTWGTRVPVNCAMDSQCQTAETCDAGKCTPTWQHLTIANDDFPTHTQSVSMAAVVDLDKDCVPDIVFNSYQTGSPDSNGLLRAIRGDNGAKIFTASAAGYRTNGSANPAVGDVDNDGTPEIYVTAETANILAFNADGTPRWKSDAFANTNTAPAVAIANIDNEGDAEIVYGSVVFNSAGKKVFDGNLGRGVNSYGPISCIADLTGDGLPELIAGRTAYKFMGKVANNTLVGSTLWTVTPNDGFCGVADFNNDKQPEVIRVATGKIYAHNGATGLQIAVADIPTQGAGGPPNIADFDGDGVPEVAAAGSSQYIVYKFNGATFTKLWQAATQDTSSQVTGSSVFDFNGDLAA